MSTYKAVNVTKFDAGGSGDNYIGDGYIKAVEKIWYDTYAATSVPSNATLDMCVLPKNKKIMGIDVYFPSTLTNTKSGTCTTLSIGDAGSATRYLNAGEATDTALTLAANANIGYVVTGSTNRIIMTFGRLVTSATASTITWIIRYT
jgi:hypothetical protein